MDNKSLDTKLELLSYQMKIVENKLDKIDGINSSITKLVTEVEYIKEEQVVQNKRLKSLEDDNLESHKNFKKTITTAVITAIIATIIGVMGGSFI